MLNISQRLQRRRQLQQLRKKNKNQLQITDKHNISGKTRYDNFIQSITANDLVKIKEKIASGVYGTAYVAKKIQKEWKKDGLKKRG